MNQLSQRQKTSARYASTWLIQHEITINEILFDMFTQFSEISSRFIHADKAKGCKTLTYFATIY